jgi:hypothetical protein
MAESSQQTRDAQFVRALIVVDQGRQGTCSQYL